MRQQSGILRYLDIKIKEIKPSGILTVYFRPWKLEIY